MMRWLLVPSPENYEEVPDMVKPTPSQCMIPHIDAIEIIPLPPVRDAAINKLRDWLTPLIQKELSVNWPHGSESAIERDPVTGSTVLASKFVEHVTTYDNWSVGSNFLNAFPEVAGRIGVRDRGCFPTRITNVGLQECKNSLDLTARKLERHLQDLIDRLVTKSSAAITSSEDVADLARLSDEWKTTRQCLEICSRVDYHVKENISVIDNYATGDAVQFMVSTNDKIIHGKNRGLGWRTRQVGGHLDNASLQPLSRDIMTINIRDPRSAAPTSPSDHSSGPVNTEEHDPNSNFRERYGQGFKLTSPSYGEKAQPQRPAQTATIMKP